MSDQEYNQNQGTPNTEANGTPGQQPYMQQQAYTPPEQGYVPPQQQQYQQPQSNSNNQYKYTNGSQVNGPTEPKKKKSGKGVAGVVVAAAVAGAFAGSLLTGFVAVPMMMDQYARNVTTQIESATASVTDPIAAPKVAEEAAKDNVNGAGSSVDASNPVPAIAETARDSVVSVVTYEKQYVNGQEPVEEKLASGSGFVISEDGYVLTNNHVIETGNYITVTTEDGRELPAELVGRDADTELAVLKVNDLNLPALPLGDSSAMRAGDMVIAIGNPISDTLQNTVTVGYLSSESRTVTSTYGQEIEMLQIDAAINPGNSGGPLLNTDGEVIGINTMKSIYAGSDGMGGTIQSEGIGFAIPISGAMDTINTLIEKGAVVKPGIGFSFEVITPENAELWQVPQGILVRQVNEGSPAQKAGLKVLDVITNIDGVDLTAEGAEVPSFKDKQVGDKIPATVWRDGQEIQMTFELTDLNAALATQ